MREGLRTACALATSAGLLTSGCGGRHRAGPASGGYAQPSSSASESPPVAASPSTEAPPPPSGAPETSPSAGPTGAGPTEIRAKETRFGRILVDGRDRTIYVSEKDNADFESTCTGPCLADWPPLFTNGQVTAGPGVNSAWLGTIGRSDGPTQVEYNGWPLYHSAKDTAPGDVKGQGAAAYGSHWYVVDADRGKKVK